MNLSSIEDNPFLETGNIFILALFSILILMCFSGNLLVILVIIKIRTMRTVTNYLLLNLSIADLLSIFHIIPNVYYALTQNWIFGIIYCKLSQFFTPFNIATSVFTFIAIAADRYMAIMYPLRTRTGQRTVILFILIIWTLAFIVGLPGLMSAQVATKEELNLSSGPNQSELGWSPEIQCYLDWHPKFPEVYDYTLSILMYPIPLFILAGTYIPICIRLWFHHEIGEVTRAQVENVRSKRRAVKMMCVVMCIFAICWLPYQLFFIVLRIHPQLYNSPYIFYIFIGCYWLAMSNGVYNPIIYFTMNRRFRASIFRLLPCLFKSKLNSNSRRRDLLNDRRASAFRVTIVHDADLTYTEKE